MWWNIPNQNNDNVLIRSQESCVWSNPIPRLDGPRRPSGPDKASSSPGSGLHEARPTERPTAPGSPAAGSQRTAGRSVQPASGTRKAQHQLSSLQWRSTCYRVLKKKNLVRIVYILITINSWARSNNMHKIERLSSLFSHRLRNLVNSTTWLSFECISHVPPALEVLLQ